MTYLSGAALLGWALPAMWNVTKRQDECVCVFLDLGGCVSIFEGVPYWRVMVFAFLLCPGVYMSLCV